MKAQILLFDINETVLDLSALAPAFENQFGSAHALPLWFSKLLHSSVVCISSATKSYFAELASNMLDEVASNFDITLSSQDKQQLLARFSTLPALQDIVSAFKVLKQAGFTLVALSNSSRALIDSTTDIVDSVSQTVNSEMQSKRAFAGYVTQLMAKADSAEDVRNIIEQPSLSQQFIVTAMGYEVDGSIIENDPEWEPNDYDARTRPWYQEAKAANRQIVTKPYIDVTTNDVIISIAEPVYKDGSFIGVSLADVSLLYLSDVANRIGMSGLVA